MISLSLSLRHMRRKPLTLGLIARIPVYRSLVNASILSNTIFLRLATTVTTPVNDPDLPIAHQIPADIVVDSNPVRLHHLIYLVADHTIYLRPLLSPRYS